MRKLILGALLAASAAAATLGIAGTASAHDWNDRGYHEGWNKDGRYSWRDRLEWRQRQERREEWWQAQRERERREWYRRHHDDDRRWHR